MKSTVESFIRQAAESYAADQGISGSDLPDLEMVTTKDPAQGDFATNLAFKFSRLVRRPPRAVAEELIARMKRDLPSEIQGLELGGNGFINIRMAAKSLNGILEDVRRLGERFGCSDHGRKKRVVVEFVSANPTGPLTIAHGRQAAVGDTIVRLLRSAGYEADAEYYLNDAGRQMNLLGRSLRARYFQVLGLEEPLPEEGYQGEYLLEIAKHLAAQKGRELIGMEADEASAFCRKFAETEIMAGIHEDLAGIGVRFDTLFPESRLYQEKKIEEAFRDLEARGFLYEKEGALWFRSTDFGDDKDRVVRKSTGELTYIAPDIAYHRFKFERGYERIVDLMGPDHHGYVSRLKAACAALGHDPGQVEIRIVQLTTLFRKGQPVRMSTRAGEFVTLKELVDEVGPDAARFFFLMRKVESPLDFDLDLAKEKSQENPVYYLQYAHARIASILRNAEDPISAEAPIERLREKEEQEVIKRIHDFPSTVAAAAEALEPYRMVDYLRELAASFHKFYAGHRVLSEDLALTQARLTLVDAVRIVLRNGLTLLGVSHPESM